MPAPESPRSGFPRWLKWGLIGLVAVVVIGYGLILLYAKVLNDSPDEFDEGDLDAALAIATTVPAGIEATAPGTDATTVTAAASEATGAADATPESTAPDSVAGDSWTVTEASEFGYRVKEVLFGVDTEGVGRSNEITGGLTIDGTQVTSADFEVDVASITSDESRRDNQFSGRIMSTDQFPTATFALTAPIELGAEPAEGLEVTADATGELMLRGVTNPVTFEVTAKLENGKIGVLGSIPVVFADYSIANPSFGGITTEDDGLVEFVLVLEPTG